MRSCLTLAMLLLAAGSARAEIIDGVAAVVNGDVITLSDAEEHAGPNLPPRSAGGDARARRENMLRHSVDDLIIDRLVSKECKEQNLEPTATEIDSAIEDVQRANHIDRPTLERALNEQGLSMAKYREMLSSQLCRMKVVEMKVKNRVNVTDDDVRAALGCERAPCRAATVQELKLRDIYIPIEGSAEAARTAATQALERLKKGEDFALVAHETRGPLMTSGGDLGWIKAAELAPELQKVVATLPDGKFSNVIDTPKGLHILKVEQRRNATDARSGAEAREEVRQKLLQERMQKATEDYLAELRRGAEVELRIP